MSSDSSANPFGQKRGGSRRAMRDAERQAEREAYLTGQQPLLTRREMKRLREESEALQAAIDSGEITLDQAKALQNPLAEQPDIDVPVLKATGSHAAITGKMLERLDAEAERQRETESAGQARQSSDEGAKAEEESASVEAAGPVTGAGPAPEEREAGEEQAEAERSGRPGEAEQPSEEDQEPDAGSAAAAQAGAEKPEADVAPEAGAGPAAGAEPGDVAAEAAPEPGADAGSAAAAQAGATGLEADAEPDASASGAPEGAEPETAQVPEAGQDPAAEEPGAQKDETPAEKAPAEQAEAGRKPVVDQPEAQDKPVPRRRPIVRVPGVAQGVRSVNADTGELEAIKPVEGEDYEPGETPHWKSLRGGGFQVRDTGFTVDEEPQGAPTASSAEQPDDLLDEGRASAGRAPASPEADQRTWQDISAIPGLRDELDKDANSSPLVRYLLIGLLVLVILLVVGAVVWAFLSKNSDAAALALSWAPLLT